MTSPEQNVVGRAVRRRDLAMMIVYDRCETVRICHRLFVRGTTAQTCVTKVCDPTASCPPSVSDNIGPSKPSTGDVVRMITQNARLTTMLAAMVVVVVV